MSAATGKANAEYKHFSLADMESIIGITRRTLLQWIKDGKLKAVKIGGRWRVSEKELQRILKGR